MWQAVLFLDNPLTPIEPWERAVWGVQPGAAPASAVWRLWIVVRRPGAADIQAPSGAVSSRLAWRDFGAVFRQIAIESVPDSPSVYLLDREVLPDTIHAPDASGPESRWLHPTESGNVDIYRRCPSSVLPALDWPLPERMSGVALFSDGEEPGRYRWQLDHALATADFRRANELLTAPRWDLQMLDDLIAGTCLYLFADVLAMPEMADPWYFFPQNVDTERVVAIAVRALQQAGIEVYLSQHFKGHTAWQEQAILPEDAIAAAV